MSGTVAEPATDEKAARRQVRRGRPAMADRPRPLEFDELGFPVAQRAPSFVSRVARLRSPS